MSRLSKTFEALKAKGEGAFIPYLMAGDPSPQNCVPYFEALLEGGADAVEIGVPFSDPIADGPVIQAAGVRALAAGTTLEGVFALVETLRARDADVPLLLMTYCNPVFRLGEAAFVERCRAAGVDGLIVPDLPLEEAGGLLKLTGEGGPDLVLMATPETPQARLERLVEASRGFLYVVSRYGVTGQMSLSESTATLIRKTRSAAGSLPLCVGFGLTSPDHVRAVLDAGADGAIVGSGLVQTVQRGVSPAGLGAQARSLKAATRPSGAAAPRHP